MGTVCAELLLDALLLSAGRKPEVEGARAEWVAEPLSPRDRESWDIPLEVLDVVETCDRIFQPAISRGGGAPSSCRG